MKSIGLLTICVLFLFSWKADIKGPWIKTKRDRIVLFTRPVDYGNGISPDSKAIKSILQEQEDVIDLINERLKVNFKSTVKIYLYNKGEAKEKIGTNGGGFASQSRLNRCIYFTYHPEPIFNTITTY